MIDVIQRYEIVLKLLNKSKRENMHILEVGSGGQGIARFYGKSVIGCDLQFYDEYSIAENMIPVKGSVYQLPFKNKSFDYVISVSMLEHLHPNKRNIAIHEMIRVSKQFIILSVPCGRKTILYEEKLRQFHSLFFESRGWLKEHEEFGLPDKEEIIKGIYNNTESNITIKVICNTNLIIWLITMIIQLPFDTLLWRYAPKKRSKMLKMLMKLIGWIMPIFDFGDTYQQVFIIKKPKLSSISHHT